LPELFLFFGITGGPGTHRESTGSPKENDFHYLDLVSGPSASGTSLYGRSRDPVYGCKLRTVRGTHWCALGFSASTRLDPMR